MPYIHSKKIIYVSLGMIIISVTSKAADNLPTLGITTVNNKTTPEPANKYSSEEFWAQRAASAGTQGLENLKPEAIESSAIQYAKGRVQGLAEQNVEQLLSRYGHINTTLNIDQQGDMEGSSLDYFIPLYDDKKNIIYTQISGQRTDHRTISNLGIGLRREWGDWLLGGNVFYDYDLSRNHKRLGPGVEAWTDYLKLSGNYYMPLSGWKNSEDFENSEERAAQGWDIRAQAFLPAYPQLGSSLVYEKYYGDRVALFGKDDLQKDPHAITVGVNYTPVPLATLGADYKQGSEGKNDLDIKASVNYQFGVPLAVQLNPDEVSGMRTLKGSRYDFVDRNNFMVLEYREKTALDVVLWLKAAAGNTTENCVIKDLPESASGLEGCPWTVNADVTSHYKITSASWRVKSMSAVQTLVLPIIKKSDISNGNQHHWSITMPAWVNAGSDAETLKRNTYQVVMNLIDEKGNAKSSGAVEIIVGQHRQATLLVNDKTAAQAFANGQDNLTLTLGITDTQGKSIYDSKINATLVDNEGKKITLYDKACPAEHPECIFITSEQKDNPHNYKSITIASTLAGHFTWKSRVEPYGESNTIDVTFNETASEVSKVVIYDESAPDINLLVDKTIQPVTGHHYHVRLLDNEGKDVTEKHQVQWVLTGKNSNKLCSSAANGTLDNFPTGVTAYQFTPRVNGESNSNNICGDQGFGLGVLYQ
ncbi:inverse autotransporter beta domain-containing protein [Siccibacter colletis]|uniref:inverse autotransporter beta domain-containing protein n=1 Tax=Siccibacter colletis TaxID=1505757 RepID=UPI003CE8944D